MFVNIGKNGFRRDDRMPQNATVQQLGADAFGDKRRNQDVRVENRDALGYVGVLRFNFLQRPFNNQQMRQALLYAVDQRDYLLAMAGDDDFGVERLDALQRRKPFPRIAFLQP